MQGQLGLERSERHAVARAVYGSCARFRRWCSALLLLGLTAVYPGAAAAHQLVADHIPGESSKPPALPAGSALATPWFMWEGRLPSVEPTGPETHFVVEAAARGTLQALWAESIKATQERVACIAGFLERDIYHVTAVQAVPTEMADSLRVSPGPSLERCGPPEWAGTVHTHIIPYRGQPYSTLSASDRAVTSLWRRRHKIEGVFCVLYTSFEAYCEYGSTLNGDAMYDDVGDAPEYAQKRSGLMQQGGTIKP